MTGTGDWPDDKTAPTRVTELPVAERRVLAALAIVGRASLSVDELAELADVEDIALLVADLERRGLIRREQTQRYSALDGVGEEIRQTDAVLSTGDRLLQYMTTLAKDGRLTPEGLLDDAEAVLGLTEWAAERQQWERLLELVKTLQACFGIVRRVDEWLTLLDRGLSAARALNDWQSEVWVLRQLATASASAGDPSAAQKHLHEADELQRKHRPNPSAAQKHLHEADEHRPNPPQARSDGDISASGQTSAVIGGGAARIALWILCLIVAIAAGGATGYAIGNGSSNSSVGPTTTRVPVTVTVSGQTVTTSKPVTLPARTVFSTTTMTLPATTVFSTTTVTTTVTTPALG